MTHREAIKEWLAQIELKDCFVADWGSGSKPVSRYIKHKNCRFTTLDKNPLVAEDRRSDDHHTIDLQRSFELLPDLPDVAFCIEVLEHTIHPDKILKNIFNNLKDGGDFYLSVPYLLGVHSEDDYLRYNENGIKALLEEAGFTVENFSYSVGQEGFLVRCKK